MATRKKLGLFLILLPFILFITVILIQIPVRIFSAPPEYCTFDGPRPMVEDGCYEKSSDKLSPIIIIMNITSLLLGLVGILGLTPSIIVGIILIATEKKTEGNTSAIVAKLVPPSSNVDSPDSNQKSEN